MGGGGGENFKHDFVLFALTTLLCPTSSLNASPKILSSLTDVDKIIESNWARYIFTHLQKGLSPTIGRKKNRMARKKVLRARLPLLFAGSVT